MTVQTSLPQRRVLPVYFVLDASGSMAEFGKWEVAQTLFNQCIEELKTSPDPDFEIYVTAILLNESTSSVLLNHTAVDNVRKIDIRPVGKSSYSTAIRTLVEMLSDEPKEQSNYAPCLVFVSDGYPDEDFQNSLEGALENKSFTQATRMVVEIGNDFESTSLLPLVSSKENFFTVMDMATMPLFCLRLASRFGLAATESRSRRILSE